jgi:pimeloyl-ACP methyl ester carboxylesterase
LEYDWRNPVSAPLLHYLAERFHLVRFDIRGTGLSDRNVSTLTFDAFQHDCEAAVAGMRLDRYALFGLSTPGAAIAVAHAAAHPERVSKLILHGGFAQGRKRRGCAKSAELSDALLALLRHGWGDRHSPFLRMFVSRYLPNGSPEELDAISELQQVTASRDVAARLWTLWNEIDILGLLPRVEAPTLILHSRHNDVSPFSEGRRMAAAIPNASLIGLDTSNHIPMPGEPAWTTFVGAIEAFLTA